ncbi:MAG: hypothetical protein EOP49_28125 [Sphingobacteriales bacterium]|nr:MAG: hypothetical protein EOP49_28125 [Sphingobacteriales bacterium]
MKHILFCLLLALWTGRGFAQIYFDPATAAATAVHSGLIDRQLDKTNDRLTLIQRGQLAVTGQLTVINEVQRSLYRGLSEVSGVMKSLLAVKDIAEISEDILSDLNKSIAIAGDNPAFLLFAEAGAGEFRARAVSLSAEVGAFVLKGGGDNLMDSGERSKLLNRIAVQLMILRGVSYGMYRAMYRARQTGLLNALNPYAGFINSDRRIADDILSKIKLLKK